MNDHASLPDVCYFPLTQCHSKLYSYHHQLVLLSLQTGCSCLLKCLAANPLLCKTTVHSLISVDNSISSAKATTSTQDAASSSAVTAMLHLVLLLEQIHPGALVGVSLGVRLTGVMSVFLIGEFLPYSHILNCVFHLLHCLCADSDLFLDKQVYQCLSALLKHYCQPLLQQNLVFPTASIMGSPSFHDL